MSIGLNMAECKFVVDIDEDNASKPLVRKALDVVQTLTVTCWDVIKLAELKAKILLMNAESFTSACTCDGWNDQTVNNRACVSLHQQDSTLLR